MHIITTVFLVLGLALNVEALSICKPGLVSSEVGEEMLLRHSQDSYSNLDRVIDLKKLTADAVAEDDAIASNFLHGGIALENEDIKPDAATALKGHVGGTTPHSFTEDLAMIGRHLRGFPTSHRADRPRESQQDSEGDLEQFEYGVNLLYLLVGIAVAAAWACVHLLTRQAGGTPLQVNEEIDKDLYEVLQLDCHASVEDIQQAWEHLSKVQYPGLPHDDAAHFNKICQAYEVLVNPRLRAIYDSYGLAGLNYAKLVDEAVANRGRQEFVIV